LYCSRLRCQPAAALTITSSGAVVPPKTSPVHTTGGAIVIGCARRVATTATAAASAAPSTNASARARKLERLSRSTSSDSPLIAGGASFHSARLPMPIASAVPVPRRPSTPITSPVSAATTGPPEKPSVTPSRSTVCSPPACFLTTLAGS
jgi:hypothetical protein